MLEVQQTERKCIYFERVVVEYDAVSRLNETYRRNSSAIFISFEVSNGEDTYLRYRVDGGDPDVDTGHKIEAGNTLDISNPSNIRELRMITSALGSTFAVHVSYYE